MRARRLKQISDAQSRGLDHAPGMYGFTTHAVSEPCFSLEHQHARAAFRHDFGEGRAAKTASYDDDIVRGFQHKALSSGGKDMLG